jgi:hypothetical protein
MWIRRHPVRTCVYAALAVGACVLVLRAGGAAAWMVNGPVGRAVGRQLGASASFDGLRLGRDATEITRLAVTVDGDPLVRISVGRVRVEGLRSALVTGVSFGETVTVREVNVDLARRAARVAEIEFAKAVHVKEATASLAPMRGEARGVAGAGAWIDSASAGPIVLGQDAVRIAAAAVDGVRVEAVRESGGRWNLEQWLVLAPAVRQLTREGATLAAAYERFAPRLRSLLWWAILMCAAAVAVAKFLLTHDRIWLRAVSAVAVLPAPFLARPSGIWVSLAVIAGVAVLLLVLIYRRAREWHQRAEPLAVDLVGPSVLTVLLAGYFYTFPALPRVGETVRLAQARVTGIEARIAAGRNRTTVTLPEVDVTGVTASARAASAERIEFRGGTDSDLTLPGYLPAGWRRPVRLTFSGHAGVSAPPPRYSAGVNLRGLGVGLSFAVEGDARRLRAAQIRSSEPSEIKIADGHANAGLAPAGDATVELTGLAWRDFAAGKIEAAVKPGAVEATLRALTLPGVRIDTLLAKASYARNNLAADASVGDLVYRSADGTIATDVPRIDTRLTGSWAAGAFTGTIGFTSSRASLDRPLQFSVDPRAGTLRVPEQSFTVSQTAAARVPQTIPVEMAVSARIGETAQLRLRIPRLELDVEPLGLELNAIEVAADVTPRTQRVTFATGWNRVRHPDYPRPNRLESVNRLRTDLRLRGDLLSPSLLDGWTMPEIRPLPERFRISGVWPELRLETDKEQAALQGLSGTLRRLAAPGSRVEFAGLDLGVAALGGRRLDLRSRIELSEGLRRVRASGSLRWAPSFEIAAVPSRVDLSVPALRTDLAEFPAGIRDLRLSAGFGPGAITGVTGSLTLDAGPVLGTKTAEARLGAPAAIAFQLTQAGLSADVSVPAFALRAETKQAGPIAVEGSVDTAIRAIRDVGPTPLLDTLGHVARLARPHWRRALEYADLARPVDWRVTARNTEGNPFLRATPGRWEVRGVFQASSVAADLFERNGNLFVDASIPVSFRGRAPLTLPVELAIGPAPLPPAGATRITIGLGERIQIHAPVALRTPYGSASAVAQAEIGWDGGTPVITSRVEGTFQNLRGAQPALVEDSFDGSFRAAIHALPVPRASLEVWRADPARFDQFHRVDLSLRAFRTQGQPGPGIVQVGMDTRVRLLNEILQEVSDKLRFLAPPQLVTYRDVRVSFDAAGGMIQTKKPLIELWGVKVLSTDLLDLGAAVRVRLGGRGAEAAPLSQLVQSALGGAR